MEIGKRLTATITGTVVEVSSNLKSVTEAYPDHEFAALKTDEGNAVIFELTGESIVFSDAKPIDWPPLAGDSWIDETSKIWSAENIDFGSRKGLRMRSYNSLGETLRSTRVFLKEHPQAELVFRNGIAYGY